MSSTAIATPLLMTDPGFLWWAPIGTAEPTHAVTGSIFSDALSTATGWIELGATEEGSTFSTQTSYDTINVAEFPDPIRYVATGRASSFAFALSSWTLANLKRALNGGTITTTGSTTTTMASYVPPATGQDVRSMLLWESQDSTARILCYQAINNAQVALQFAKGVDNSAIACEFTLELPSGGNPFKVLTAGVARTGA